MNVNRKPLTIEDVQWKTSMQKSRIEHLHKILADPDRENRIENQECVLCHYDSKIGGAAMTQSTCGICETETHSSNTNIDRLCKECAKNHRLCKHCGADIEYKNRRTL